jgi:hypothetical protein
VKSPEKATSELQELERCTEEETAVLAEQTRKTKELEARVEGIKGLAMVVPARYCQPRRPPHFLSKTASHDLASSIHYVRCPPATSPNPDTRFEPLLLESNGIVLRGERHLAGPGRRR